MRYLGIDFGTKKVGLALSDEAGTMGFPHSVIPNNQILLETVCTLIKNEEVQAVVIGESRNFIGGKNVVAKIANAFADQIHKHARIPVHFEPETMTTQEALRLPDGTRMRFTKTTDASAAALILTSYLSRYDHH